MATYYRRSWAEGRGDAYDAWGRATYFFESDDEGAVSRQVEDYEHGPTLRYDVEHSEDEFGFLTDQPIDREEFEPYVTTKAVFETAWTAARLVPLSEVAGDLFALDLPALGHGCNCKGVMGAGVAREFRRRYPHMYAEYRHRCLAGAFALGDVLAWEAGGLTIYNLGTQPRPGPSASLTAIESSVGRMLVDAEERRLPVVGVPRIGAGLGGLPWASVREVLARVADGSRVLLTVATLPGNVER